MNTLALPPVSTLLTRLFDDADATQSVLEEQMGEMTPQQRASLIGGADWRSLYTRAKDAHLAVSRETGRLLYMLAHASRARSVV
ncbi:MAG TPA: hypothetical protein VNQ81_12945, partial [Povalibacter sp.]|nr:hypothetical protein [Povalibacter sp.]